MASGIEVMLDNINYEPTGAKESGDGIPVATHSGKLKIGDVEFTVYVLSNGQRIIPADEIEKWLAKSGV